MNSEGNKYAESMVGLVVCLFNKVSKQHKNGIKFGVIRQLLM